MKAIDTNILVRYVIADDMAQFRLALKFIESGEPKLLNPIVLVELAWVLKSVYQLSRYDIVKLLIEIGDCGFFVYKKPKIIADAINDLSQNHDLADALLMRLNQEDGATETYTFDKKAATLKGYSLLA